MIHVDKLSKYFGPVLAVDRVSFDVDKGEIVGFLGPNGAGKTTTMRILTTYLPATSGIAKVAGFDVMTESLEVRRNIGYLPESVPLYAEMRVDEYLQFRAKLKGVTRKDRSERVEYCMDRCRLREVRRRLNGTLSKGYRQRVGLADAMISDPPILILDEPTSGLDPLQIRETLALIKELGEQRTVLLSTHILSEVEAICERVIIINGGRVGLSQLLDDIEREAIILVEARGPSEQIATAIRSVSGVVKVASQSRENGLVSLELQTEENSDLREQVSDTLGRKGWPIRRLERKRRRLEDAFLDVVRAQDPLKEAVRDEQTSFRAGAPTAQDDASEGEASEGESTHDDESQGDQEQNQVK
ncbi:MAG: ATP-binding cassette domain-containing protein [Planctomycetes bacterium]|nr:ATP-binding cassette domain-containing protein [Planctomycetota bacterium]